MTKSTAKGLSFQEIIFSLQQFWQEQGCVILPPYDMEMGAGTFHPATALRTLGPEHWHAAYVQPSRRPADGRYGDNPNRLQHYYQFQVVLKPAPADIQDLYIKSLAKLGLKRGAHDIRFIEDDWESPTLGASGLGWEVRCDGMEVSQFTYFQEICSQKCDPVSGEITYGLERLAMFLQQCDNVYDLRFNDEISYGALYKRAEREFSAYNFEYADIELLKRHFKEAEAQANLLIEKKLALPAYEQCLKASHLFNLLDARGAVSATARPDFIGRVRALARGAGEAWLEGGKTDG